MLINGLGPLFGAHIVEVTGYSVHQASVEYAQNGDVVVVLQTREQLRCQQETLRRAPLCKTRHPRYSPQIFVTDVLDRFVPEAALWERLLQ